MSIRNSVIAITIILVGFSMPARAGTLWAMPAVTCIPADPAIQNDRYSINGGGVIYKGNNVDLISLYCPITDFGLSGVGPTIDRISMTYRDSDGNTNAATIVAAALWEMNYGGGITSLVTISSNEFSETGIVQKTKVVTPFDLNFAYAAYYIRIDIDRQSYMTDTTAIYSVALNYGLF